MNCRVWRAEFGELSLASYVANRKRFESQKRNRAKTPKGGSLRLPAASAVFDLPGVVAADGIDPKGALLLLDGNGSPSRG